MHTSMLHFRTCGKVGPSWCSFTFRNTRYSLASFDSPTPAAFKTSLLVVATCPVQRIWLSGMAGGSWDWTIVWMESSRIQVSAALSSEFTATRLAGWPRLYLWLPAWPMVSYFFWHSLIGSEGHLVAVCLCGQSSTPACFRLWCSTVCTCTVCVHLMCDGDVWET